MVDLAHTVSWPARDQQIQLGQARHRRRRSVSEQVPLLVVGQTQALASRVSSLLLRLRRCIDDGADDRRENSWPELARE